MTLFTTRTFLVAVACALPLVAAAQWQWLDKDGRKVFSDQAPPSGIPEKNILRRPAGKVSAVPVDPAAAAAAPAAPKLTGKDKELEEKKKQQDAAAQAKKKEEEAIAEKNRAANCERAKSAKASYDSGVRIGRVNAKGEREVLDEAARAADTKRLQALIDSECSPRPVAPAAPPVPAPNPAPAAPPPPSPPAARPPAQGQ